MFDCDSHISWDFSDIKFEKEENLFNVKYCVDFLYWNPARLCKRRYLKVISSKFTQSPLHVLIQRKQLFRGTPSVKVCLIVRIERMIEEKIQKQKFNWHGSFGDTALLCTISVTSRLDLTRMLWQIFWISDYKKHLKIYSTKPKIYSPKPKIPNNLLQIVISTKWYSEADGKK